MIAVDVPKFAGGTKLMGIVGVVGVAGLLVTVRRHAS